VVEDTVIHAGTPEADHEQPVPVAIDNVLDEPAAGMDRVDGVTVNVHPPACVTVNVLPAMITPAVRDAVPGLAATVRITVPLPDPDAPEVTTIHEAGLVAVQLHAVPAPTLTLADSPPAAAFLLPGLMEYVHVALDPLCETVNVCPAMVMVPLRLAVAVLADSEKVTLPGPVTEAAEVTVIQVLLDRAVHAHVAPAPTDTEPVAEAAPNDAEPIDSTGAQGAEAVKVFEIWLAEVPPGPTADTRAS
jgi:hypothetical protein